VEGKCFYCESGNVQINEPGDVPGIEPEGLKEEKFKAKHTRKTARNCARKVPANVPSTLHPHTYGRPVIHCLQLCARIRF
jgi:hypothetical protein